MAMKQVVALQSGDNDSDYACNPGEDYGLRISLSPDVCEQLGITTPPQPGAAMGLNCVAVVCRIEQSKDDGDDDIDTRLSLQITHMEIVDAPSGVNAAKALYGDTE